VGVKSLRQLSKGFDTGESDRPCADSYWVVWALLQPLNRRGGIKDAYLLASNVSNE
jgi:hypothetical protein